MPDRRALALALLAALTLPHELRAQAPPVEGLFRWLDAEGVESWSARLAAPTEGVTSVPLGTAPRFRPLPPFEVKLLAGGTLNQQDLLGKVVLLDFWASWCAPCLEELPHLQKLFTEEQARGLAAVAINADEPLPVVKRTVARLGLSLPVGLYDDAIREAFGMRTLPTLVLADRQGRIRARWDGYTSGLERTIAERTRALLGDDPEGRAREIAKVVEGAGSFEVAWAFDSRSPVSGLATFGAARTDGIVAAAAAGDQLALLDAGGAAVRRLKLPSSAWRLTAPRSSGRGAAPDLLAFRSGSAEILSIDIDQGMMRGWSAPGPVFDVAFAAHGAGEDARVWLATLEGLGVSDLAGSDVRRVGEPAELLSAAAGSSGALTLLLRDGTLRRLDASGAPGRGTKSPPGARHLVGTPGLPGVGLAPESVAAYAVGSFLGGTARQAALGTYAGELAIVDLEAGRVLFRAAWPGITALVAGDLDGDGRDDLLVGAGRTIAALRAAAEPSPRPGS